MKSFFVRLVNLLIIVVVLFVYNITLTAREKEDEITRLSAELKNASIATLATSGAAVDDLGKYKDGTFSGEAEGFGGMISVEVMIEKGSIQEINILSADKEDGAYLTMAQDIIGKIIDEQSVEVDTISGATFSSTGIKNAVAQALKKAGQ